MRKRDLGLRVKDPTPAFRTSIPMWRTKRTPRPIISDPSFGYLEYVWDITLALRFPPRLSRLVSSCCCIVLTAQCSCTICFNEIIRKICVIKFFHKFSVLIILTLCGFKKKFHQFCFGASLLFKLCRFPKDLQELCGGFQQTRFKTWRTRSSKRITSTAAAEARSRHRSSWILLKCFRIPVSVCILLV